MEKMPLDKRVFCRKIYKWVEENSKGNLELPSPSTMEQAYKFSQRLSRT